MNRSVEKTLKERFGKEPGILAVWGLGSAFSGVLRRDSDVDFAILYDSGFKLKFVDRGILVSDLEAIVARTVDIGRLSTRNLVYAHQAVTTGQLIYYRNRQEVDQFVGRVYSLYLDFKLDRKIVEEAYCA